VAYIKIKNSSILQFNLLHTRVHLAIFSGYFHPYFQHPMTDTYWRSGGSCKRYYIPRLRF